jgi:thiol-disulfide isomerase/thioredoxin
MTARNQWLLIIVVAVVALGLGMLAGHLKTEPSAPNGMTPERIYSSTFHGVDGRPQPLERWKGKVVVLNFWATWCPPCRAEIPEFVKIQAKYAAKGFTFVGIALDERDAVAQFAKEFRINYPLLLGGAEGSGFANALGSRSALPFSVVMDRHGNIVATRLGTLNEAELEKLLPGLL